MRQHHFTLSYKGFDVAIDTPPMSDEQAEVELQEALRKNPDMEFVGKDWATPKAMVS